ncbi:PEPxxWA-CTERM sorting domain-containing protein [Sandaracinobacter sp. RS1-74]|uniref:PEPxxWA-CTERM sorting domain-containing protein n=1 Tax=Sandaracinobacteroides sayramensis TaxID=2913411 RepID=UPI001EDC66CA|nr:PEPxxWA-CTERM sorting domain-containing protein [Sandaracinobacteroides sayramensis]MCG2839687.1 PEPxxWA-CTERM sorting domain-containing protein [Sandaracinobacteroides sayramensis]
MHKFLLASALVFGAATAAQAALPQYPNPGTFNEADYSFTALATGDIVAYFAGHTAGYTNWLRLEVNGVDTGLEGLNNQVTALGTSFNFGSVNAGDKLVFKIRVVNTGEYFYSQRSLNPDGLTHIYSADYAGGDWGIPAGVYVGFEDLLGGGDRDYDDLRFVFTNVGGGEVGGVPEPTTWAMLIAGFGLVGVAARRRVARQTQA